MVQWASSIKVSVDIFLKFISRARAIHTEQYWTCKLQWIKILIKLNPWPRQPFIKDSTCACWRRFLNSTYFSGITTAKNASHTYGMDNIKLRTFSFCLKKVIVILSDKQGFFPWLITEMSSLKLSLTLHNTCGRVQPVHPSLYIPKQSEVHWHACFWLTIPWSHVVIPKRLYVYDHVFMYLYATHFWNPSCGSST